MRNLKRSKRAAGLVILTAFLTIGVFGFAFMEHGEGHSARRCIVSLNDETRCSSEARPMDSGLFHLNAFKSFSLGAFQLLMLTIGLVFLAWNSRRWQTLLPLPPEQVRFSRQRSISSSFHSRARWLRWLALTRKTDSF